MKLGERIKAEREARGWTQPELSDKSGVDVGTISALEVRKSERSKFAPAIAKAFGLTIEELLRQQDEAGTPASSIAPPGITLEAALEVLGMALAREMPADVREDVADALAKLARRKGQARDQQQVQSLLTDTPPGKAHRQA